jgi:hypothetical protein
MDYLLVPWTKLAVYLIHAPCMIQQHTIVLSFMNRNMLKMHDSIVKKWFHENAYTFV